MTNQEAKSGNGTPRAPRYPENFSRFSVFSTPANQNTKKRYTLIKNKGTKSNTTFGVTPFTTQNGKEFLFIKGGNQHVQVSKKSDVAANLSGYISLTPMRADLTAFDRIADLEEFL